MALRLLPWLLFGQVPVDGVWSESLRGSLVGMLVWIVSGTGAGQARTITDYRDHTLAVSDPWMVAPGSDSEIRILHP